MTSNTMTGTPRRAGISGVRTSIAAMAMLATAASLHGQTAFYVDDDAPPGGDGLSWSTAMRDLQDALDAANARPNVSYGYRAVVRIAQGVYVPGRGSQSRSSTFSVNSSVAIIGGYAGIGEPNPASFNPSLYPAILSGDLAGNDTPDYTTRRDDNAYHVMMLAGGLVRGVTVRGGNANGEGADAFGGGIVYTYGMSQNLRTIVVEDCDAMYGGGITCNSSPAGSYHGYLTIDSSRVQYNRAMQDGGGVYGGSRVASSVSVSLYSSTFNYNVAGGSGGAVAVMPSAVLFAESCLLQGNRAAVNGGALDAPCPLDINACDFISNYAGQLGGAVHGGHYGFNASNSRFLQNLAAVGGATYAVGGVFTRSLLAGNGAEIGGAIATFEATNVTSGAPISTLKVYACTVVGNVAAQGAAIHTTGDAMLTSTIFRDNQGSVDVSLVESFRIGLARACIVDDTDFVSVAPLSFMARDRVFVTDPLFVDPDGADNVAETFTDNNYAIRAQSPAIDRGHYICSDPDLGNLGGNDAYPVNVGTYTSGMYCNGLLYLDIGADEFPWYTADCAADTDGSGDCTPQDIYDFLALWIDGDVRADYVRSRAGTVTTQDLYQYLEDWTHCCR
jgi:hypothetical protein